MLNGYQLAELCLERSSGLRFSGNTPTWQKIPKSKQTQIRRKSRIRGLPVAEPKPEISVQYLWSESQSRLMLLLAGLQGGCLAAACYSISSRGRWTGRTAVCAMTQICDSLPIINLFFHKKWVVREQLLPLSLSHPLLHSHSIILKDQIWLSLWCLTLDSYSFTRSSKKAGKFCRLSFPGKRARCPCIKPFHCGGDGKRDILHAWGRVMTVLNSTPPSPQKDF